MIFWSATDRGQLAQFHEGAGVSEDGRFTASPLALLDTNLMKKACLSSGCLRH